MPTPAPPSADRLVALLESVRHAPSVLNTQPWRFRVVGGAVDLFADRTRQLRVLDPEGRELTISCGAALAVLRIAARHDGLAAEIHAFSTPGDPDHLARVTFAPTSRPPGDDRLYRALQSRRTNRQPFAPDPLSLDVQSALAQAVAAEGAWLRVLDNEHDKEALAALVETAVIRQGRDADLRADIEAWLRPDGDPRPDGVRDADQGAWDRRATVRTPASAVARHKASLVREAPAILVLGTDRDEPSAWLRAGLALGRALVVAADRGLAASYVNEPVEVGSALRDRVADLAGGGAPQVILRVGRPVQVHETPRRPLRDVVQVGG